MNERLSKEYRFLGHVLIRGGWCNAIILVQPDLKLHIFLPGIYRINVDEEIPKLIKGRIEDWDLKVMNGASSVSFTQNSFNYFNETIKLEGEEIDLFPNSFDNKMCTKITFTPKTCTFTKVGLSTDIPDEWGLTYYPEKNNRTLFHFFNNDRNPRGLITNIISMVDKSIYFKNTEKWTSEAIQKRLPLLTSCLSLLAGAPVSYSLLVGRNKREVLFMQIKNESNPNAYVCPSPYNAHIGLNKGSLSTFSPIFINEIEALYNSSHRERILTLLLYFNMLYMVNYDEAKIAFSFQLMEALAKYKGMNNFKRSSEFDKFIAKALDAIKNGIQNEESLEVNPASIKELARKYRNEVFHGNFFENMTHIYDMIATLPEGYQRDLPLVFQAIVAMIGVNFILGIDFDQMIALKRSMYK